MYPYILYVKKKFEKSGKNCFSLFCRDPGSSGVPSVIIINIHKFDFIWVETFVTFTCDKNMNTFNNETVMSSFTKTFK